MSDIGKRLLFLHVYCPVVFCCLVVSCVQCLFVVSAPLEHQADDVPSRHDVMKFMKFVPISQMKLSNIPWETFDSF